LAGEIKGEEGKPAGHLLADEFLVEERRDEAVAEKLGEGFEGLDREFMEAAFVVVEAGGGEDVEVERYPIGLGLRVAEAFDGVEVGGPGGTP